jgi:hypothetical protein
MRRKLTKAQKAKNKAAYKTIRKEFNKVKNNPENYDNGKLIVDYKGFKNRTLARAQRDNISVKQAAQKEARTESFKSAADRSRENLIESIKTKHRGEYEELKNLSRSKGKYQSIKDNLTWDKNKNGYVLNAGGKQYFIDITNSPEEVTIQEIQ